MSSFSASEWYTKECVCCGDGRHQCACGAVAKDEEECHCDICPRCGVGAWETECDCTVIDEPEPEVFSSSSSSAPVIDLKPYQCPTCIKVFMDVKGHIKRGKCKGPPKPKPPPKPRGRPAKPKAPKEVMWVITAWPAVPFVPKTGC